MMLKLILIATTAAISTSTAFAAEPLFVYRYKPGVISLTSITPSEPEIPEEPEEPFNWWSITSPLEDAFYVDGNGDGKIGIGDAFAYSIRIRNSNKSTASNLTFRSNNMGMENVVNCGSVAYNQTYICSGSIVFTKGDVCSITLSSRNAMRDNEQEKGYTITLVEATLRGTKRVLENHASITLANGPVFTDVGCID